MQGQEWESGFSSLCVPPHFCHGEGDFINVAPTFEFCYVAKVMSYNSALSDTNLSHLACHRISIVNFRKTKIKIRVKSKLQFYIINITYTSGSIRAYLIGFHDLYALLLDISEGNR